MTKKDYELIARTLRDAQVTEVTHPNDAAAHNFALKCVANTFARELEAGNARFNRATFLRACGVEA